ncbi:hypothetical protein IU453_03015 [Nocardia cyriacigeorgica]|uniref:PIN-like domain-containing protein n=1 Tax=Nocardia cyriacigeorgica TaxID=135487 RepID=UPI001895A443|nr:hypothetical protein [Nocardia cyriacigeorgica]MBF6315751.1 hypothetical protein [Nocardia cyriacigeorgica]MBF6530536.1 hypothetical protein [Nocardia cyriacigeorgica]
MKFFLDENLNQQLTRHLGSMFSRGHRFLGVRDLNSQGVDDNELFKLVAGAGVDAFITSDLNQIKRQHERAACREAGLHWIGVHQAHAKGYHVLAAPAAALIHSLPFILDRLEQSTHPQLFLLKKTERNYTQVFDRCSDL